jgi:hypothetical protein
MYLFSVADPRTAPCVSRTVSRSTYQVEDIPRISQIWNERAFRDISIRRDGPRTTIKGYGEACTSSMSRPYSARRTRLSNQPRAIRLVVARKQFNIPSLEVFMRYACLIYDDEKLWPAMPKADSDKYMGEYSTFTEDIKKSGQYVVGEALHPTSAATTVRVRNGKVTTTDGPFADTKEQFGGFYVIEAKDLNDAIQVASRIPSARLGSIEVRPIVDFSA